MRVPGLSDERLDELHQTLAGHVADGSMPGLVALVGRHGQAHVDVIGTLAVDDPRPMGRDAIFRIASMTKPMVAVVAMTLVDDGSLQLDAPVEKWLPELADRRVLRSLESEVDDTVPAVRPITVEDVFSFRLGYGTPLAMPGTYPIQRAEAELDLKTMGPPWPPPSLTPDQWIAGLGTLPLLHQPGQGWLYNTGAEVLGVLVERVCGQPLGAAMRARLFDPLGMVDTDFSVPAEKRSRFTTAYFPDDETGELRVLDGVDDSWWSDPPMMPNGAGWLVSTIDDCWAFAKVMLAGGEHPGGRILSAGSVELMTTDRLTDSQRPAAAPFMGEQDGWGLGLAVPSSTGTKGIPGGFGWDGGTGTSWRSDPDLDLTGILLTQRAMMSPEPPQVVADFWAGAYAAVES